ncbi:Clp protease N-terminal domain-containing protein [Streptomyces sp. CWNU-52B]
MTGATTEFEPDVMDLLVAALRTSVKRESSVVGTDVLLDALVMGDTAAGAAITPGMRAAGSLGGLIAARSDGGWATETEDGDVPAALAPETAEADTYEVDAAWREAQWRNGFGSRGAARESGRAQLGMTGALRTCLLLAIRAARAEGTVSVRCWHVARSLVDLPDSRAREALLLQRLDPATVAAALDGPAVGTQGERPQSHGVVLLRRAGTLGKSGNRLTRALTSWTAGAGLYGSPVLAAVSVEALRQATRYGRVEAGPVDLLLGILALDRALSVAGRSLPESLAAANAAPALAHRHGVRQTPLTLAAVASAPTPDVTGLVENTGVRRSEVVKRIQAVAHLSAAEHGSPTVGTVHLLSALLDEPPAADVAAEAGTEPGTGTGAEGATEVVRLLRASGEVDVAALRAELGRRLGA